MLRTTALAALAILAGCGGDSGSEADAAKEDYLEQANAICAQLSARTAELADRRLGDRDRPPSEQQLSSYEARVAALQREALTELRALPPPAGDEQRLTEIYDAMEAAIGSLASVPPGAPGKPGDETVTRFSELARSYGLSECAGQSA